MPLITTRPLLVPSLTPDIELLLHAEDFTDSSLNPKSILNAGSVGLTGSGKFGSAFDFTGSTTNYVRAAHSNSYNLANNDFTLDFWVQWPTSVPAERDYMVIRRSPETIGEVWSVYYNNQFSSQQLRAQWAYSSTATQSLGPPTYTFSAGQWYHIALTREYIGVGTSWLRLFVDGVLQGSTQSNAHLTRNPTSSGEIYVGNDPSQSFGLNGYIDEVRVSNGVAYWTSNFTPPTAPYG